METLLSFIIFRYVFCKNSTCHPSMFWTWWVTQKNKLYFYILKSCKYCHPSPFHGTGPQVLENLRCLFETNLFPFQMNSFTRRRSLRPFLTSWTRPSPKCPDTKNKKLLFQCFSVSVSHLLCFFLSPPPTVTVVSFFTGDKNCFFTIKFYFKSNEKREIFLSKFFQSFFLRKQKLVTWTEMTIKSS